MVVIRVPYPKDPEQRRAIYERAMADLTRFGTCEGDTEAGWFQGSTPIGGFAGSYRSPVGSEELEIELTKKPWLVSSSMIEREARRFFSRCQPVEAS
jgi:hypothetical protein